MSCSLAPGRARDQWARHQFLEFLLRLSAAPLTRFLPFKPQLHNHKIRVMTSYKEGVKIRNAHCSAWSQKAGHEEQKIGGLGRASVPRLTNQTRLSGNTAEQRPCNGHIPRGNQRHMDISCCTKDEVRHGGLPSTEVFWESPLQFRVCKASSTDTK